MPPEDENDTAPDDEGQDDSPPPSPGAASIARPPEDVRRSPEYIAQQKVARDAARRAGRAERELAQVRGQAELDRAAAEADRQEQESAAIEAILGTDGLAEYNSLAELSSTDPVGAARKLAALMGRAAEASPPADEGEDENVDEQPKPPATPATPRTLSASAPLAGVQADEAMERHIAALDARWTDVVAKNQRRERLTDRERSGGIMAYLESSIRSGKNILTGKRENLDL